MGVNGAAGLGLQVPKRFAVSLVALQVIKRLGKIRLVKIKGLSETNLKLCRLFYLAYPHLVAAIKSSLEHIGLQPNEIGQSLTNELKSIDYQPKTIRQTLSDEFKKTLIQPEKLLANLSYSHFSELMTITDIHKRTFFEMETIKGGWNVRELRRGQFQHRH